MEPCGSPFLGLDVVEFWRQMERCFAGLLGVPEPDRSLRPDPALLPVLRLDPPPDDWPDPAEVLPEDEEGQGGVHDRRPTVAEELLRGGAAVSPAEPRPGPVGHLT